jgi:hypothetical protein
MYMIAFRFIYYIISRTITNKEVSMRWQRKTKFNCEHSRSAPINWLIDGCPLFQDERNSQPRPDRVHHGHNQACFTPCTSHDTSYTSCFTWCLSWCISYFHHAHHIMIFITSCTWHAVPDILLHITLIILIILVSAVSHRANNESHHSS